MNEIKYNSFNYDFLSLEENMRNFITNDLDNELFQIDEDENLINSDLLDFIADELEINL